MTKYKMEFTRTELITIFWALNDYGIDPKYPEWEQDMADQLLLRINEELGDE